MQIPHTLYHLKHNLLHPLFGQLKTTLCDVVKEILARHILKYDVVKVVVLEQINQFDYVLVLAHLQYFDFPSLLVHFDRFHVCLCDCFYRSFSKCFLVSRKFYYSKLTLAQIVLNYVEVMYVTEANCVFYLSGPLLLHLNTLKVKYSRFIWRNHNAHWIKWLLSVRINFRCLRLNVSPCQAVHDP